MVFDYSANEAAFEKFVKDGLEKQGCVVYKMTMKYMPGIPDLLVLSEQYGVTFIEIKKLGGTLSSRQNTVIGNLIKFKTNVFVVNMVTSFVEDFVNLSLKGPYDYFVQC